MLMKRAILGTILGIVCVGLPSSAFAATATAVQTSQLIPLGGNSCAPLVVSYQIPYVYDSHLDSFDLVIPDRSYVAIGGMVGNTSVPFYQMTRSIMPDGQLRLHTDIESTSVGTSLPVSLTLLSSTNGVLCASVVSFSVERSGGVATQGSPSAPSGNTTRSSSGKPYPSQPAKDVPQAAAPVVKAPVGKSALASMCAVQSGAYALWLVLIVLFMGVVAAAALMQPGLIRTQNPATPVALILVPLILLVGFWYFSPTCRVASWIPIVLLLITIVGLLVAFREKKGGMLLLPTIPMRFPLPMPKGKPTPTTKPQTPIAMPAAKPPAPVNGHVEKILSQIQSAQQKVKQSGEQPPKK